MEFNLEKASFLSFWISPDVNFFDPPVKKILKKNLHRKCNSGQTSPYQDQSSLIKLKSTLKTITRKQSPTNNSVKSKRLSYSKDFSILKNNSLITKDFKKKILKKKGKKSSKSKFIEEKLKVLNKKECKIAPKIYENQIFCDIYDTKGNHDRVMETFEVSESKTKRGEESFIENGKFIIANNLEIEENETEHREYKPPENSFIMETEKDTNNGQADLLKKLQILAMDNQRDQEF